MTKKYNEQELLVITGTRKKKQGEKYPVTASEKVVRGKRIRNDYDKWGK